MSHHLTDTLNSHQQEAVTASLGHQLILAGAGSGKTRVLIHRIAWLIEEENQSPFSILAVTFTNKAAAEMRHRLEALRSTPVTGMWVGTFHGIAHRLLRAHWRDANLPETFQILDSSDQNRLVRRVLKELGIDETQWPVKQAQWFINGKKDEALRPQHIEAHDVFTKTMVKIYTAYEAACARAGVIDFAELLLRAHELWLQHPELLQHYQQRFKHILIDEFQDTNALQYAWIRLLAGKDNHLMLVGDDDQSIYGWRGAKIENILRFTTDYPTATTIRLEQNYRSTGNILSAANKLISHNGERLGKNLWTEDSKGEPISVYAAFNELDEARFIVSRIQSWFTHGNKYSECAILYRSNAQSRVLEECLLQNKIPYRVYGGQRFFERIEIKDALAYLRLLANRNDDPGFERVINTPTRGIGDKTVETVRDLAREQKISLWEATKQVIHNQLLPARATSALENFQTLIDKLDLDTKGVELYEQTDHVIQCSGLYEFYRKEKGEKGEMRLENLDELITATRQFDPNLMETEVPMSSLHAFLSHAALEAGDQQADKFQDSVQLMTLHSAKGLEFPLVFMAGVEEGLFPHEMSMDDPNRIEEERRLCYVGITRAMKKLYLTYAETRRLHGREVFHRASRFLRELPIECIEEVRLKTKIIRPAPTAHKEWYSGNRVSSLAGERKVGEGNADYPFRLGATVQHNKFGHGTVLNYDGQGMHARIHINFKDAGAKWLMLGVAKLIAL